MSQLINYIKKYFSRHKIFALLLLLFMVWFSLYIPKAYQHYYFMQLKKKILSGEIEEVKTILHSHPEIINVHSTALLGTSLATELLLGQREDEGYTPLHYATAVPGDKGLAIMQLLINNGADVNVRNSAGETPLMLAVKDKGKWHEKIEMLVKNRADINAVRRHIGTNAVYWSICNANLAATDYLLKLKSDYPDASCVISGLDENHFERLDILLRYGFNINSRPYDGETTLYSFCDKPSWWYTNEYNMREHVLNALTYLKSKGYDINQRNANFAALEDRANAQAWYGAAVWGNKTIVELLIQFGIKPCHDDIDKLLIAWKRGMPADRKDTESKPFQVPIEDQKEIIQLLEKASQ